MLDASATFVQDQRMLVLRVTKAALFGALLAGCGGRVTAPAPGSCVRGRTVVIVRHAEKASEGGRDPSLSDRGQARANRLARMLGSARVTKIFATPYKRTQETVRPLSERTSVAVEAMTPEKMREALDAAADGSVVVAATHSNVIPRLVDELAHARLRGVEGESLAEDDYARVIVIARPCGTENAVVTELESDVE